jgi:peptidyl-prolyl cis-trans isomerase A (cyclophilin A)
MPRMKRPLALALALAAASPLALAQEPKEPPKKAPAAKKGDAKGGGGKELYATFVTSAGKIGVRLTPDEKPLAVKNFVELATGKKEWADPATAQKVKKPLYDGTLFHRVIPNFMIQGGDPKTRGKPPAPDMAYGTGNPGYAIPDELTEGEHFFDQPCQLAYANSGPNTSGAQFFITEVPTLHLNPRKCTNSPTGLCGYTRFGEGVCGCDLVAKIAAAGNSKTVLEKVVISSKKPTCE